MWWKSAVNFSFFLSLATFRLRSSACDTLSRHCVRRVLCWPAFPSVPALGSPGSAACFSSAGRAAGGPSALFAGFIATMAGSDFSCPCIIGYGSSPSRCGPSLSRDADGQTRDLPGSDAIPLHVMWPSTPAGRQHLAFLEERCRTYCLRANKNPRLLRRLILRGSIPTPHAIAVYASQPLSPVTTQHSLPSGRCPLLGPDFHPLDRTSLPGALTRSPHRRGQAASRARRDQAPWRSSY